MTGDFNLFDHPAFSDEPDPNPGRELVRIIIFGSKEVIRATIHDAHLKNFRRVDSWSPLLPTPDPKVFMSISTEYRSMR
ncbi:hypothetical protein C7B61_02035 [filamentous cyanobacterium CCP1]|nr:hypothetical protein C7B76_15525 [filamentous cyanobacterium CCP2]PSB68215.1 hypothetical protein C7B61_02035 [filamentous cyanobacterium CCP1]